MKTYYVVSAAALVIGIVGGAGFGGWSAGRNYFEPTNAENPLPDEGSAGASTPANARPRAVVVNGETYDFGSMRRGIEMEHTFYIRNTGQAPLRIETRETTCKCTISKLDKSEIMPNETVGVTLEWHARDQNANFRQTAIIATNDPEREFIQLRIEGLVEDTIRIEPTQLRFVNLSANDTASRSFRIYGSPSVEELSLVEYEFMQKRTAEYFNLEIRDLTAEELAEDKAAALGMLVTVTVKPGLPTGDINQTIRLKTSLPEAPEFNVEVAGNVIGDISILGRGGRFDPHSNVLSLGGVEQAVGGEAELLILIKGPNKDNVQIEVGEIDPVEGLHVTLGERKVTGKLVTYSLVVKVPAGAPRMTRLGSEQGRMGRIVLKTNSVTEEIPIFVKFAIN